MAAKTLALHDPAKVEDYIARGWFSRDTVDLVLDRQVEARGEAPALVDPLNKSALVGTEPRRLTWTEVAAETDHLAAELVRLGLHRGDVLAVQMPNSVEMVEVFLAAWKLGVVVSPLAVQYRQHELSTMSAQAGFAAYLTSGMVGRDLLDEAREAGAATRLIRVSPPDAEVEARDDVFDITAGAATDDDRDVLAERLASAGPNDPNDAMTICWTSGTEAEPKGVPRTHLEWLAGSWAGVDGPSITAEDVILNPFPMINMAAFVGLLLPWLQTGCVLVQHHPFDLPTFLGQIARERVTYTVAPPALLMMLLHNETILAQADLSSVTRLGSGSAPLQPAMVKGWQDKFGISVINFFGSNEGVALLSSPEDFPDPEVRARFFPNYWDYRSNGVRGVHLLLVLRRWHAVGEGDGEGVQSWLPPHGPSCLTGALGV